MRLTERERTIIRTIITEHFGSDTPLLLFGSRVNDQLRGGDIDLYIESDLTAEQVVERKIQCLSELKRQLGDQKIDLVIKRRQNATLLPIHDHAKSTGIPL